MSFRSLAEECVRLCLLRPSVHAVHTMLCIGGVRRGGYSIKLGCLTKYDGTTLPLLRIRKCLDLAVPINDDDEVALLGELIENKRSG